MNLVPRALLRRQPRQHPADQLGIGAGGDSAVLGTLHLGRRHHLHRLGDLGRALDALDAALYLSNRCQFLAFSIRY